MKTFILWVLGSVVLVFALMIAGLGGFWASYKDIGPFNELLRRYELRQSILAGEPTEMERRIDTVETTNVRLRGKAYAIPRRDFSSGGALAPWGDDLLVLNRRGTIRRLIEGEGIVPTAIQSPYNGHEAYEALATSDAYATYDHRPVRQRYNELLRIDTPDWHGLAISYTHFNAEDVCYGTRVAWLDVPRGATAATFAAAPEDWEILFETSPCLELNPTWVALEGFTAGGRMAFEAPGTLYLGSGDYHLDGVSTYDGGLMSPDSDYGKVIAIDLETGTTRHHSVGHRNMQGVALDLEGRLWTTEHMMRGGDELNLIREGGNYGWPEETYGTLYNGQPWPGSGSAGRHELYDAPAYAWLPSSAVSGLTVIDGFHPAWDGDLLATSLSSDEHGQSLYRIRVEGEDVIFAERIRIGERLRYVTQWGPNRIAVLVDNRNAVMVFRAEDRIDVLARSLTALEAELSPDVHQNVAQIARTCNECHSYERGNLGGVAPSLAGVLGRPIGGSDYRAYSTAMANHGGTWDAETLKRYLTDPESIVPGTSMPAQGLQSGPALDGLINLLSIVDETAPTGDLPYN